MDTPPTSSGVLEYIMNHVFLPPKHPQQDDNAAQPNQGDIALCRLAQKAAAQFSQYLSEHQQTQWSIVTKMLRTLVGTTTSFGKEHHTRKIMKLKDQEALVFHIRAQNAALILRRKGNNVVFEAFEVSVPPEKVMEAEGKLLCSYPGPAIELPLSIAQDQAFVEQLVSFLSHMDVDQLDSVATTVKAGSRVQETRGTTDPKYITQLLIAILHGMGKEATVDRITKRIADDVCWDNALNPWRRSPFWLVLRVAVQRISESREIYKAWMLFFHNRLLQMFLDNDFSSDLLYTARVKTSRRAYKLGASASPLLLQMVKDVGQAVQQRLQERWSEEQQLQASSPSYVPDLSIIEKDTTLSLLKSRAYLTKVLLPDHSDEIVTAFYPSHEPRLRNWDITDVYPNGLLNAVKADPYIGLADFEFLVQERLSGWTSKHLNKPVACEILGSCLEQYIAATKTYYVSNPEDQSVMLLTILDLWVALDTITCSQYPLLRSYSPEIPASILDPLLVRGKTSLGRAATIERHLRRRHSDADSASASIYSAEITRTAFAVQYFEQSAVLQALKSSIEHHATTKREAKRAELQDLNARHAQLMREVAALDCEYYDVADRWGTTESQHSKKRCSKCKLEMQAKSMRIDVHEWPLSSRNFEVEATVFEIKCPLGFSIWRNLTYQILRDIGMAHVNSKPTTIYALKDYDGLTTWLEKGGSWGRITFASTTKSFLVSHYRSIKIPTTEDSVCVNNGLRFQLYDKATMELAHSSFPINIHPYCTLRLPDNKESLYKHLQYAVAGTTHAHNLTIVKQSECPINLSVHEQLAFSGLRCGSQLQWMNIARELRTKVLSFSCDEVHTLLMQAAWQMGPLANDGLLRIWHVELGIADFGSVLFQEATDLLSHVGDNWMEINTVKSIIYLTSRLLASATDLHVREKGYALLRKAREISHQWMREIIHKLQDVTNDDNSISELRIRACETAAICRATFDVDVGPHVRALLSPGDVAVLVECAIVIHDNAPHYFGDSFSDFQRLLHRDRRLSHFLEASLVECICSDRRGLDTAIVSLWPRYRPARDTGWQQLPEPNSRWVMTLTDPMPNQRAQRVHYDMLSGKLVIDGKALARLPQEIVSHSIYKRIFGQKILDIIPADMPGMDYATRFLVHDYQVFFAYRHGARSLIIQAQGYSGQIFELIPHDILAEDFPYFFSTDYVHWMDIGTGKVEFRPLDRLWQRSSLNWHLDFSPYGPSRMFHGEDGTRKLIDVHGQTFQGITACLRPLEHPDYITIIADMDCQTHLVSIELLRLRLSFFLNNDNELESNNMQGMVIDLNQCTGTMVGLSTQLVLRHKDPKFGTLPRSRLVLIPYGEVHYSISPTKHHVRVHIDTRCKFRRQVVWYKYDIDSDLGQLVGSVNLTSRLFRIYLHALCSHPLPDPLTAQRGTDHALQELDAASCFSFQQLTSTDVELLDLVGKLSPNRNYYPKHLRAMQTTAWSPFLPVLSQHGSFDTAVSKITQYAQSLTIFPELHERIEYQCHGNPVLMMRAARRHAIYYEGSIDSISDTDKKYYSRDCSRSTPGEIEALRTSQLVYTWPIGFVTNHSDSVFSGIFKMFENWGKINGLDPDMSLTYSKEWLHLDLSAQWLSIYELCRQINPPSSKFELIFSFSALAYRNEPDLCKNIPILLACATIDGSLLDAPPQHPSYKLTCGFNPLRKQVLEIVSSKICSLDDSPSAQLPRLPNENSKTFKNRAYRHYKAESEHKIDHVVDHFMAEWPCSKPRSLFYETDAKMWFRIEEVMDGINKYFAGCFHNLELRMFASKVSTILKENSISPLAGRPIPKLQFSPQFNVAHNINPPLVLETLLLARNALSPPHPSHCFGVNAAYRSPIGDSGQPIDTSALVNLISQFERNHRSALHQLYGDRLEESRKELHGQRTSTLDNKFAPHIDTFISYRTRCQSRLSLLFSSIHSALAPLTPTEEILMNAALWPPISQRTVLQLLASTASVPHPAEWSEILIAFAEAFIEYQHSQRLVGFSLRSEVNSLFKELDNASFNHSDARKNPNWLLIQIQGNFMTRPIQSQVAREMIEPSSKQNIALQLNMGEGKSHVIVPLVAAALANSQKFVRVIVLKPLAGQMFQLLVERLSGLANRRIFYLPFSRDVKANPQTIQNIQTLFKECARVRGVLVAQPEHILSLRLMGIDQMLSSEGPGPNQVARDLQATQKWLHSNARDILDESDEILHVRYQLIYTVDQQQSFDDGPYRWITTQKIFDLVRQHMRQLHEDFPEEVELVERHMVANQGTFSHFRLVGVSASQALVSRVAEDALNGQLDNLTFVSLGSQPSLRSNLLSFITINEVDPLTYRTVKDIYEATGLWKSLLLLRGLLGHGILVYALSRRRWRVDYGLDPKRSLLAVPYRAKDVPSLRSEFGHPDMVVCLTCLSYYYGGLTATQVRDCFELLSKLDNPALEYESWVKRSGEGIPIGKRQLIGVNMKDLAAFTRDVTPLFQYNKGIIDFYLARVVFAKEAKEFPFKLGTSGWDLAETKANFTTGFSGTNDNSDLLPTSITQSDPVNQLRTNAQVLEYLLRPENDKYLCSRGRNGQPCSATELLDVLVMEHKEIRVLLDVGAQMLEMTNRQLIEHWLSLVPAQDVAAGVFFDDSDNLSVLTRDGLVEPLHASPFFQQLSQCIIYLDDSHTRGTDLKLPLDYRALVTLGPKVTKDKLVQGCMRMRNLGHGQSVVFCAPPEVDRNIRRLEKIDSSNAVQVIDVLSWAMSNTCADIEDHIPHWVQQGVYFHQRQAGNSASQISKKKIKIEPLKNSWLQSAARNLDEMYGLKPKHSFNTDVVDGIPAMHNRLKMLGIKEVCDEPMAEEQEREVNHEVEEESQLERPPEVPAAVHKLDEEVRTFVQRGIIPVNSESFLPLMAPLRSGSDVLNPQNPWAKCLLATRDFMTTTKSGRERSVLTEYLRPINWIVSHVRRNGDTVLVVMSPYEVNTLLEVIRRSRCVRLHIYAPRTSQSMKSFDDLAFYCIPPVDLQTNNRPSLSNDAGYQLNIWSGQLYFDKYETYLRLCLLLGISSSESEAHSFVESDRFVPKGGRTEEMEAVCLFDKSPLQLLKILVGLRRKGMGFQSTHMGKILQASLLLPKDFEA